MSPFIFFILAGIAAWRITHLIIDDAIMEKPVNLIVNISRGNKYLFKLLTCYYCLGFWVSLALYLLIINFTNYFQAEGFVANAVLLAALASFPPLIQEFIPEE